MRLSKTKAQGRQDIVNAYRESGEPWPTDSKTIAAWAIRKKLWEMPRRSAIDVCAREISEGMREEMFTDPQGRRVRKKHALRITEERPDGKHIQKYLWLDIEDDAEKRDEIHEAFQQRRAGVFTDCRHLKTDVDSYNENGNPGDPIPMLWDFTDDLAEYEMDEYYDDLSS